MSIEEIIRISQLEKTIKKLEDKLELSIDAYYYEVEDTNKRTALELKLRAIK